MASPGRQAPASPPPTRNTPVRTTSISAHLDPSPAARPAQTSHPGSRHPASSSVPRTYLPAEAPLQAQGTRLRKAEPHEGSQRPISKGIGSFLPLCSKWQGPAPTPDRAVPKPTLPPDPPGLTEPGYVDGLGRPWTDPATPFLSVDKIATSSKRPKEKTKPGSAPRPPPPNSTAAGVQSDSFLSRPLLRPLLCFQSSSQGTHTCDLCFLRTIFSVRYLCELLRLHNHHFK